MTTQQRNKLGMACWSALALLFGVIMLVPMVAREIYQYRKYLKPCNLGFEWLDVAVYGLFICIFSLFHWCILDLCIDHLPWWLAI